MTAASQLHRESNGYVYPTAIYPGQEHALNDACERTAVENHSTESEPIGPQSVSWDKGKKNKSDPFSHLVATR